jgi:predicted transposase/invertase (TIGR01784 family)
LDLKTKRKKIGQEMEPNRHIAKAHDHFFRRMMTDKRVAREFFAAHLPADVLALVDFNQLTLQASSYINDIMKESIADMLFSTQIAGHEAYLYLLVDHQSSLDELMPFRVLKYVCNSIDQHLKSTRAKHIPFILPLVVYHGKQPWHYSTNINDLVDAPKQLVEAYFLKPFTLIDLNKIEDDVLKQSTWAGVMELTLKHIFSRDMLPHLKEIISLLQHLEKADGKDFIETVLLYILDRGELGNKDTFIDLVKTKLAPEVGEKVMTIAEQLKAEGMQQGIQQGMQQGMQQGEYSLLLRQLQRKFHEVPESYRKKMSEADAETLLEWGERIVEAEYLDDIFTDKQ